MNRSNRMNFDPRASRWEHETAMLASSMELVSIAEDGPSDNVGFRSRLSPSPTASRVSSGASLTGWGTLKTRESCKNGLCDLAGYEQATKNLSSSTKTIEPATRRSSATSSSSNDLGDWGFFG